MMKLSFDHTCSALSFLKLTASSAAIFLANSPPAFPIDPLSSGIESTIQFIFVEVAKSRLALLSNLDMFFI